MKPQADIREEDVVQRGTMTNAVGGGPNPANV